MKAYIDKRKCSSDSRICKPLAECPEKAISWIEDEEEPLGSRMEIDQKKCTGCGICVPLCCGNCIEVRQDPSL
ncbi:MAG: 4Fe-4S binding protein [Treponema sp.]|nr:4Fe-4S binding protein [Treponema sp.]